MRVASFLLLTLVACRDPGSNSGPPLDRFYFPGSLEHVDAPGTSEGVLFVANANMDKRYATGSLHAVPLDKIGLPALGASTGEVPQFTAFDIVTDGGIAENQSVQIASFAGEMAMQPLGNGRYRFFIPTRSEGMRAYRVEAKIEGGVPALSCVGGEESQNCTDTGASLSPLNFEQSATGLPRAPAPYGVAYSARTCTTTADCCAGIADCTRTCTNQACIGSDSAPLLDVFFTHISPADSPALSGQNFNNYLVRLDSDTFGVDESSFVNIGAGGTSSIVTHKGWSYVTGRFLQPAPNLMRIINRDGVTLATSLESLFRVSDSRGIALSSDRKKLFIVGRTPDTLLVASITNADTVPSLSFVRGVALPDAPNQIKVIPRQGKGDLVIVSCTSGGSLAVYDDDVGDLVSIVTGVGVQPYGLAVDHRDTAARVYVSNFGDGRIAVLDVPDLARPQLIRLVAHVGIQQLCLTRGVDSPACRAQVSP